MGRHNDALSAIKIAEEQDPTSVIIPTIHGLILLKAGRVELAEQQLLQVLGKNPNFDRARGYLIDVYEVVGNYERALEQWSALKNANTQAVQALRNAYRKDKAKGYWEARNQQLNSLAKMRQVSRVFDAVPHCRAGDMDQAIEILQDEVRNRNGAIAPNLLVHPIFDPLRSDERFRQIIEGIGFPNLK